MSKSDQANEKKSGNSQFIEKAQELIPFLAYGLLLAILTVLVIQIAAPFFKTLFIGALLAIMGNPVYKFLRRKRYGKTSAALIVSLGIFLLIILPVGLTVFLAATEAINLGKYLVKPESPVPSFLDWFHSFKETPYFDRAMSFIDLASLREKLAGIVQSGAEYLVNLAKALPEAMLAMLLAVVTAFFLLIDGKRLLNWFLQIVPFDDHIVLELRQAITDASLGILAANIWAALTQAFIMGVAFLILGAPGAFLAVAATFVFAWIPFFGSGPVWITGIVLLVVDGHYIKAAIMLVFGIIASSIDNVVRSLVMQDKNDLHPLVGLLSVFGGIHLFGVVGVILGPFAVALFNQTVKLFPHVIGSFRNSETIFFSDDL